MIDVCICTHNPRRDIFTLVLKSLAQQSVGKGAFRVLVVDNASDPRLSDEIFTSLRAANIETRLAFEPTPGLQRARISGIEEITGDWILWVDDDNELSPTFIADGLDFISQHPEVGCLGGRLILPPNLSPKPWVRPFLPFLGIKDAGEDVIIQKADEWGPWEPAGAGAWVHRRVLEEYQRRAREDQEFFKLGRAGSSNLASCDDSFLMRGAFRVDMACAYVPQLQLLHHLSAHRFNFRYLMRLMSAYGSSHVILESILKGQQAVPHYYANKRTFAKLLLQEFSSERKKSLAFGMGSVIYHLGARREYLQQARKRSLP